jgi:hypothetical protein
VGLRFLQWEEGEGHHDGVMHQDPRPLGRDPQRSRSTHIKGAG